MESPKLTRSKTFASFGQLKVHEIQEKVTQQPRKPRQRSLRIIVLKKNYRKRVIEEINEKKKLVEAYTAAIEKLDNEDNEKSYDKTSEIPKKKEAASEMLKEALRKTQTVGNLNGGRNLIKPTKFTSAEQKITSKTLDDIKKPSTSSLRHTKSFSGTSKPHIEIRKPKLVSLDVKLPSKDSEKSSFCLTKPSFFKKPAVIVKDVPGTPVKARPHEESNPRPKFGFMSRSLFSNGNECPKNLSKNSSYFYLSSEAALSQSEKFQEMNEKLSYVRQLEDEFNKNKIKRQKVEEEDKEVKIKKRLSFGKNPLHNLVQGGSKMDLNNNEGEY